ncbi:flagellar biosynthesis anti-sigma factor FlgM [Simiduia curdlanivorans]|uniref:Negative regulator of flagellin synthesis n=1 Tax=Simiduia curdlanivorans TaxID=1492769 RepID=A0ABV8V1H5_9GAMM|nr:flagellar biosynthesis anti-sigma factor FlgM [Simiduia curdlanivorans]MDN3639967.1 flagellar biosynthesis anti-sigma factor FlgM [Simiduia curdlanivorans]
MIIDPKAGLTGLSSQQSQRASQKPEGESGKAGKTDAPKLDSVQLSDQAHSLKRLEDNIAAAPAVNEDKVAALRAAIADGSYQINANSIAEKMLASEGI